MQLSTPRTPIALAGLALVVSGLLGADPAMAKDGADDSPSPSSSPSSTPSSSPSSSADDTGLDDNGGNRDRSGDPNAAADNSGRSTTSKRARVRTTAPCSSGARVKLTAKSRDGRIEVELEVDSNRAGQRWTYTMRTDGALVATGRRVTSGRSGSFSVERKVADPSGTNAISATARNSRSGQTCRVAVTL